MTDETEPPNREFADRGLLWLLEAPENLRDLLRLVARDVAERLDFTHAQRVNRSFIPNDLHKQEADLLYRVPFREESGEVWIYVLVEHQSRPDRTMGLRLLSYMVQVWEGQRRSYEDAKIPRTRWRLAPIVPLVFYSGRRRWSAPLALQPLMDLPPTLAPFVPTWQTLLLNLQQTPASALRGSALGYALRTLQASEAPTRHRLPSWQVCCGRQSRAWRRCRRRPGQNGVGRFSSSIF